MSARVRIDGKNGSRMIECDGRHPILQVGLAAGVPLPYECATGTCGTCRATVLSGQVEAGWAEAPGLTLVAKDGGVLLCQCRPSGDCVIGVAASLDVAPVLPLPGHVEARLVARRQLTRDMVEVTIALRRPLTFRGGQFVLIEWPGVEGPRAYSMVDAPGTATSLKFVIKDKPGGGISDKLFRAAPAANDLRVFGPLGHAFFDADAANDMILLAGGSGLGPLVSVLRAASEFGTLDRQRAHLVFGVRTADDVFYLDELGALRARHEANLAITLALSEQDKLAAALPPAFEMAHGMVHEVAEGMLDGPIPDHQVFVAGPPQMVDACLRVLVLKGRIRPAKIKYDKYS